MAAPSGVKRYQHGAGHSRKRRINVSQSKATAVKGVVLNPNKGRKTGLPYSVRVLTRGTPEQRMAVSQNLTEVLRSMIDAELAKLSASCDTENIHAKR